MSNWTHVAAIARIDGIRFDEGDCIQFATIFGKQCLFTSPNELWKEASTNPEKFLPMGSEGSLRMTVWVNPDLSSFDAYTVSIFGDLRDHDSADDIVDWFKNKLSQFDLMIRQATITVTNEIHGTVNWTYSEEE